MAEKISGQEKSNFICGVIEGFYGRPWTTEQRKDLFRKLKKWGMDSYVYAPKDDYKHRAYWRELYTVEEADHLSSLIAAAKDQGIIFYYALSPGLDMTYSNQKEIQTLKRKLEQVSQFGCQAFALLFDDIDAELSKADKEVYQTFANAQVSVTNEIFAHLGNPKFLFCPTQYCSSRAIPTVTHSEYLNTLGSKLNLDIDIMWTGNKVISKIITIESIQEITEILRRPPVIWDNLHANDYDQKRVFLGPYSGRSPELIPYLRGVMTNPNCEFHANTIAIHTLASWSKCSMDAKVNSSISADIKLETENDDGTTNEEVPPNCLSKNVYHPRMALKSAISEWLPEFFIEKEAWGPIKKPQPQVTMVLPIIPIIPSVNTCMSLTTTTTTSTNSKTTVPEVNTTHLQALAEVCSTVNSSLVNPIGNSVMNSLVSATKVITNDDILNPITSNATTNIEMPKKIPISCVPVPIMHAKQIEDDTCDYKNDSIVEADTFVGEESSATTNDASNKSDDNLLDYPFEEVCETSNATIKEDDHQVPINATDEAKKRLGISLNNETNMLDENNSSPFSANEPMECSSSLASQTSPKEETKLGSDDVIMSETASVNEYNVCSVNSMQVESSEPSPISNADMVEDYDNKSNEDTMTVDDLYLLCDLFYLPFDHGYRGFKLLNEFNWLKANANVLLQRDRKKSDVPQKPEIVEWQQRAERFSGLCHSVQRLLKKISCCANKEICHDLFSYVWDITGALMLLNAFVKWLSLGHFPENVYTFTQGSYTWFSKGWKEAFMSGDQEPWVFRGGLTADLQRLMPVDSANDLFMYKLPDMPTSNYHTIRPYNPSDEEDISKICTNNYIEKNAEIKSMSLSDPLRDLISDILVGHFLTLSPEFCIIAQNASNKMVGYSLAALDVNCFVRNIQMCWMPAMCEKYPKNFVDNISISDSVVNDKMTELISFLHDFKYECPPEVVVTYPSMIRACVINEDQDFDHGISKRLITVTLAILRSNGSFGVHVQLPEKHADQIQFYTKLGFNEVYRDVVHLLVYLGRRF